MKLKLLPGTFPNLCSQQDANYYLNLFFGRGYLMCALSVSHFVLGVRD